MGEYLLQSRKGRKERKRMRMGEAQWKETKGLNKEKGTKEKKRIRKEHWPHAHSVLRLEEGEESHPQPPNSTHPSSQRWEPFVRRGITRIGDPIFDDHLGTFEEITRQFGRLPGRAVDTLLQAIPRGSRHKNTLPHARSTAGTAQGRPLRRPTEPPSNLPQLQVITQSLSETT